MNHDRNSNTTTSSSLWLGRHCYPLKPGDVRSVYLHANLDAHAGLTMIRDLTDAITFMTNAVDHYDALIDAFDKQEGLLDEAERQQLVEDRNAAFETLLKLRSEYYDR